MAFNYPHKGSVFVLFLCCLLTVGNCFVPPGWTRLGAPESGEVLTITLGLKQSRSGIGELKSILSKVSDPHNQRYGQYLTRDAIDTIIKPKERDVQIVETWVKSNTLLPVGGLVRSGGDALQFQVSVKEAEFLFNTTLYRFCYDCMGRESKAVSVIRSFPGQLKLPAHIMGIVEVVSPIYNFLPFSALRRHHRTQNTGVEGDDPSVIPLTIKSLYGIGAARQSNVGSTQAVAEMQHALGPEGFAVGDLNMYQQSMGLTYSLVPKTVVGHNDGIDQTGECTLDTDLIGAVAEDAAEETTFWLVDEWMYELGLALHNTKAPPLVVSISWGYAETRQCGPTDFGPDMPANCTLLGIHSNASYVERVNVEFMKLALRGITLVASSGDRGAPGSINADCSHDRDPGKALNPGFPAASPYVLSVGATSLSSSTVLDPKAASTPKPCKPSLFFKGFECASNGTEQVCSTETGAKITSGGGFSRYSPRPKWQSSAVESYLNMATENLPPKSSFNSSNRAFPDVSAIGHNVLIYLQGTGSRGWDLIDGTSASAPIWAAMITRWNRERLSAKKPPLGFINPMLYDLDKRSNRSAYFSDLPNGNNKCTTASEGPKECCKYGYTSAKNHWDPVTGLGTPKFQAILEHVKLLP
jgi:tripeptidyl-peptidase-1